MKRFLITLLISGAAASVVIGLGHDSAATHLERLRPTFEFSCGTTESEFYDWVESDLWRKPRRFQANLATAIDALVSSPAWTIRIPETKCENLGMPLSKRESILFMIDDALSEGAGFVETSDH